MKTLVISAIIAMTSLVNVVSTAAVNRTDNFAYNTETNDGRVETQTVFKVENQKFLHRHLKYNYIYDNSGRISQKEVLKWTAYLGKRALAICSLVVATMLAASRPYLCITSSIRTTSLWNTPSGTSKAMPTPTSSRKPSIGRPTAVSCATSVTNGTKRTMTGA